MISFNKTGFAANSIRYTVCSIVTAGISFIVVTILARYISSEEIGKIEAFVTFGTLFQVLLLWGNESVLVNYYSKYGNRREFSNTFKGLLRHLLPLIIIVPCIHYLSNDYDFGLLYASLVYGFLNSLKQIMNISFQLESKVTSFMRTEITFSVVMMVLCFIILIGDRSFWVRAIATLLALLVVIILYYPHFYKDKIQGKVIDRNDIKDFYKNGSSLAVSNFASWGIERVDRFQVNGALGMANLGIYSIATQFSMGAMMIGAAISRAWQPYVVKNADSNRHFILSNIIKISIGMTAIIMIIAVMIYGYMFAFMTEMYMQSAKLAIVLCLGYAFDGIWKLYNNILVYENKFRIISVIIIICALLKLVLNQLLIPQIGLLGAAFTAVGVYLVGLVFSCWYVHIKLRWFK